MKIIFIHIIILLSSLGAFGQPLRGNLLISITDNNKIIEISSKYESLLGYKAKYELNNTVIIKSIDEKYTFIFDHPTTRGDYYSTEGFPNYIFEKNIGSSFIQRGWIVNSKIIVVNEISNDTMAISIKNVFDKSIILDVKFAKGNFVYDAESSKVNNPEIITELSLEELIQNWKKYSGSSFYQNVHRKIYLNKIKAVNKSLEFDYKLIYPRDSIYIDFKYSGDFGIIYYVSFELKKNVPDGKYEIYIDNKLTQKYYIKNGLKDSLWVEYQENGERREIPYHKDTIDGNIVEYYDNNIIKRRTVVEKDSLISRETYSKSGVIQMKEHFRKNRAYKIDKYDKRGKLTEERIID